MRILILNQPFHPDVVATAQMAKDLADDLTAQGHHVTAIASRSVYGKSGATLPKRETIDNIDIIRVGINLFGKSSTLGRIADFAGYYLLAAIKGLTLKRFDTVICLTTPPYIAAVGLLLKGLRDTRVVYWLMDVYPDVMVAHDMIPQKSLRHRFLQRLHRAVLDRVDATIVLGRCMRQRLLDQGAEDSSIFVIPVWSVSESGAAPPPPPDESNAYRKEWNIEGRLLVMYSGNFGLAHDIDTFLSAALLLKDNDQIRFAFVGGGKRKPEVEKFVKDHNLANCIIAEYQPRERLAELLAAADIHLVTMLDPWWGLVVPSKFFGIAAAARAAIFIGPPQSEIARAIHDANAGFRFNPGEAEPLANQLAKSATDRAPLHEMGLRAHDHVMRTAARSVCTERIAELLSPPTQQDSPRA